MINYKGYYVKTHPSFPGSFIIVTEGRGGKIPDAMKGLFTSIGTAKILIDSYTDRRDNASKTRTKSRD